MQLCSIQPPRITKKTFFIHYPYCLIFPTLCCYARKYIRNKNIFWSHDTLNFIQLDYNDVSHQSPTPRPLNFQYKNELTKHSRHIHINTHYTLFCRYSVVLQCSIHAIMCCLLNKSAKGVDGGKTGRTFPRFRMGARKCTSSSTKQCHSLYIYKHTIQRQLYMEYI